VYYFEWLDPVETAISRPAILFIEGGKMSYEYKIKVFSAEWCPNCKILKKNLEEAGIEFSVVDCDSDEGMEEASQHGIRALPVTFIYENDEIIRRVVGLQPIGIFEPYRRKVELAS